MITRYLVAATDQALQSDLDSLNQAYLADMRAKLGRGPNETIDSIVNRWGDIVGPADRVITTALVEPITSKTEVGGLVPVDALVELYLKPSEVTEVITKDQLPAKWQSELDTKAVEVVVDVEAIEVKP